MIRYLISLLLLASIPFLGNAKTDSLKLVFKFEINRDIGPAVWRITQKAVAEAEKKNADYIIIRLNTYGGLVDAADSIRTRILNCEIPVLVFIDNNAASAGALIAISADSIYMRQGASIGAASVVDQQGKLVPDKYQSYMRAIMRSTAEAHGKKPKIENGDTVMVYHRDPLIAEAMVDPRTYIPNLNDTGKVLTMTSTEAMTHGYCEGMAENIEQVLELAGIKDYKIETYQVTQMDKVMGFLMNPFLQGILIMIIIAGIYFELQTPGLGFPSLAAVAAALLYFSPLYVEGLAANWEIIAFAIGLVLVIVEVFVTPGFGVAGIAGVILIIIGLTMAMVESFTTTPLNVTGAASIFRAFLLVIVSVSLSLLGSIFVGSKLFGSRKLHWALAEQQNKSEGYIGVDLQELDSMIGKSGFAHTVLRPSGNVEVDGAIYDAKSLEGFIEKGTLVTIVRHEAGQVYVKKVR